MNLAEFLVRNGLVALGPWDVWAGASFFIMRMAAINKRIE